MMIRVCVSGAAGKMGQEVARAVAADPDLALVGCADPAGSGQPMSSFGISSNAVCLSNISECIATDRPDVIVDFTAPGVVMTNIKIGLEAGVHMVVGTTGIEPADLAVFEPVMRQTGANLLVAPNFAVGAILMMRFAQQAARYFPDAEIVELHHNAKADAPSGTSLKTAAHIAEGRASAPAGNPGGTEMVPGARGAERDGTRIHSVRLPGLVAHQEVLFGGQGQTLSIRHDSIDRTSFMPGVVMALKAVGDRPGLTFGLENVLQ